jgi:hypothetical protein
MKNSQQNHNMRAYIDIINEGAPVSEAHIDFPYLPPELELNMNPTEISDWRQRKIDDYLGAHGEYNPYKADAFSNAVTNKAVGDLEATDDLTIKNDRAFGDPLPDEPIDDLEDDIPLAVSKLALKTDPYNELGYTPNDTELSDVVSKEEAQRDNIPDSYKLTTPITGKLMHDDGTYSHITANPDGSGKIDSSVRDAIIYTKKLKAKLAAKKAAVAIAKAKKDKEEVEAATAKFMAGKEAKEQRARFNTAHNKEHVTAKKEKYDNDVQTGRARFLAMRAKQEEERKMRREFLRKQQIENQKKRQAYYNSVYGRRPYR